MSVEILRFPKAAPAEVVPVPQPERFHARGRIVACPKCGGLRYDLGGVHAPRFNADLKRVDCVGEEIQP